VAAARLASGGQQWEDAFQGQSGAPEMGQARVCRVSGAPMARALVVAVVVAALGGGSFCHRVDAQTPVPFRAVIDLVKVDVTVTDGDRRFLTDLKRDDFVVFEDNRPQAITFFEQTGVPLAVSLVMDTSASMQDSLALAQESAIGFVSALAPPDVASIIDFDSRVQVRQAFTTDHDKLDEAIRGTTAGGATALYNALYIALRELDKKVESDAPGDLRRRAIVLLSDGADTSSLLTFEEVLEAAVRSGVAIYAIGLGGGPSPSETDRNAQYRLRRLARQTGGRAFFPIQAKELLGVYREIRDELSKQYTLAYESSNKRRDGQYRQIAIRVTRQEAIARTRPGYYAPTR
jgi:Ca-activated chloride channel homolog